MKIYFFKNIPEIEMNQQRSVMVAITPRLPTEVKKEEERDISNDHTHTHTSENISGAIIMLPKSLSSEGKKADRDFK